MDTDFLARLEATPVVVIDMGAARIIRSHNRTMASLDVLTGRPSLPVRSIQEWDELEARLGALIGPA